MHDFIKNVKQILVKNLIKERPNKSHIEISHRKSGFVSKLFFKRKINLKLDIIWKFF